LYSCSTDFQTFDSDSIEVENRTSQPISVAELDVILNRDFTFNDAHACLEKQDSIPFSKTTNGVTPIEVDRISSILTSIISNGIEPYNISIDDNLNIIDVFGSDGNCELPVDIAGPCTSTFEDRLDYYLTCDFMPAAQHMPIQWSFFCKSQNPTIIPSNEPTTEYFENQVNSYYPRPNNTLYVTQSEKILVHCDGCDSGEIVEYSLWHRQHGGTNPIFNTPDCLDKDDMDNYFCNVHDLIESNKPEGLEFSHIDIRLGTLGNLYTSLYTHWVADIWYGTPVYCCECCC